MTTDNLTTELERLNELDERVRSCARLFYSFPRALAGTIAHRKAQDEYSTALMDKVDGPDAVALANKLHALLVQAEGALCKAVQSHDNLYMGHFNDAHGCANDLAIIPARETITAIRAAGIGG